MEPIAVYATASNVAHVPTVSASDAFGDTHVSTADGLGTASYDPVGFGGQFGYYKEYNGHYLLGHRYYDAGTGRFVTRDPIGYGGGINLYGFCGNNPVMRSDPSGFDPEGSEKAEGNPWQSEQMQEAAELAREKDLRDEEIEKESEQGTLGRALSLRDRLNPAGARSRTQDLIQSLNQAFVQRLRLMAGFNGNSTPIIVDNSIGANPQTVAADLRAEGYNARSVGEIFGRDPKDPAIRQLARQLGGRVLASERRNTASEGFGELTLPISQKLSKPPSVVNYVKKVFPK